MKRKHILALMFGIMFGLALAGSTFTSNIYQTPAASVASPFIYTFNADGTLKEAGSMEESTSPYFWLNSGGRLIMSGKTGGTIAGETLLEDIWRVLYARANSLDTDSGAHPQNLFRLVTRSTWSDARQEALFLILDDHFSASPNRNASNGLLLMHRYRDQGDTLYYAGVRVDGKAVIKKKYKGAYYTVASKSVFPGTYLGSEDNANLIPHRQWIGLRSETKTLSDGGVRITLYMRKSGEAAWTKLLEANDSGQFGGTPPIAEAGYAGIRTDFMDVRFENYRLEKI